MYRPKGYKREQRKKMKEVKRVSWYKPYDSVLFCPPTPQSELFKQLNEVAQERDQEFGRDEHKSN